MKVQIQGQKYLKHKKRPSKRRNKSKDKQENQQEEQLNKILHERFSNFIMNQKMKKLQAAIENYLGRNTTLVYNNRSPAFSQQWQNRKSSISISQRNFLESHNVYIQVLAIILLIGYALLLWFISFARCFNFQNQLQLKLFYSLGIIITFLHALLKTQSGINKIVQSMSCLQILKQYAIDTGLLIYFIFNCSYYTQNFTIDSLLIRYALDLFFFINAYIRCGQIYTSLRMKVITSIYKDIFNLLDLLKTSLIMAHLFSIILYIFAIVSGPTNWLSRAEIDQQTPLVKYIYSFYYATTTMLTVGYGDLSPTNEIQIISVLFIQIFGIAIFAYVINEIGHTLSSMRQQQQSLQKDLSSLSKVAKYYQLNQELQNAARAYIMDNQTSLNQLLPQEQKQLLLKLNDELRQEIHQQNSLKIIKSSIFFICHWSKKMQFQIAKKLIQKLFTPNAKLLQIPGKQCIYIIKKGKVDIETDRQSGGKSYFKKLLNTIEIKENIQISHNVYGYTATISTRPIKLKAIAKDFTVAYFIQKHDFLESIMDIDQDFQYYHEIKNRLDMQKFPEAFEAPAVLNFRSHYDPTIQCLIMKNKRVQSRNDRQNYIRGRWRTKQRRTKLIIYQSYEDMQNDIQGNQRGYILTNKIVKQTPHQIFTPKLIHAYVAQSQPQLRQNINNPIDIGKQYVNYFNRFNLSNVLFRMERDILIPQKKVMSSYN